MKHYTLTRTQAMEAVEVKDPRVFRRDYGSVDSCARTSKATRQRMYNYDDLMARRAELDPKISESEPELVKDMTAWRKQYKENYRRNAGRAHQ